LFFKNILAKKQPEGKEKIVKNKTKLKNKTANVI